MTTSLLLEIKVERDFSTPTLSDRYDFRCFVEVDGDDIISARIVSAVSVESGLLLGAINVAELIPAPDRNSILEEAIDRAILKAGELAVDDRGEFEGDQRFDEWRDNQLDGAA